MIEIKNSINNSPLVTIGVMVYNEEKYLATTLESILQQEPLNLPYSKIDYEIIIGDNASDDNTNIIARKYADRYSQVRYIRRPENIGALQNFNSLVKEAKGKYFVLAGAHDIWSSNYLKKLTDVLEKNSDAVLSYSPTVWIDKVGKPINKYSGFVDTSGYNIVTRFNLILWSNQHAMYGLYRLSVLRKTRLQLEIFGSGAVLLGELAILGRFIVAQEAIWYRRMVRKETRTERVKRYSESLFSKKRTLVLPHWRTSIAYFAVVFRAKVTFRIRLLLIISVFNSFIISGHLLIFDLISPFYLVFFSIRRVLNKKDAGNIK